MRHKIVPGDLEMSIAMRVAVAVVVLFSATSYTVEISKVEHNSAVDEKQFVKP